MLESELLSPHMKLKQVVVTRKDNIYLAKGEAGPHIKAVQKALNALRKKRSRNDWARLNDDGIFGEKTLAAVKECQDYLNRYDRKQAQAWAESFDVKPGSQGYKKMYYDFRMRIKSDGLLGWRTLFKMDMALLPET